MDGLRQKQQTTQETPLQTYLQLPRSSFESLLKEVVDFAGPDKAIISSMIKSQIQGKCNSNNKGVLVPLSSLKEFQKDLQAKTGFGSFVIMHAAGRAAATGLRPKSFAECKNSLEGIGFTIDGFEISDSSIEVHAQTQGLDYFFLGLLEGLSSSVVKKEVDGRSQGQGSFMIIIQ